MKQRDLELILLGAALADRTNADSLKEFRDGEIGYATSAIKSGDLKHLRQFMGWRGVNWPTLEFVRFAQRRGWIEAEIKRLMTLGAAASGFKLPAKAVQVIEQLEGLRRELETINTQEREALAKLGPTNPTAKSAPKAGPPAARSGPGGPGPVSGSKPGVRVPPVQSPKPAGGPRPGKPGPAPHSENPPRSGGVPDKPLPPVPRSRTQ